MGSGEVITPALHSIKHWVWNFSWHTDIQKETASDKDPKGKFNDTKLSGIVLVWLVLEYVVG